MPKPLLFFSPVYSFTAEAFVEKMFEVGANEDIEIWINSPGGSVFAGWSMIGALNERTGKNNAKVMGDASSMIAYLLLFMDKVEAIDVANFTIHRADGYVSTPEDQAFLDKINKDLRAKMEKKINAEIFKSETGFSFDDIFNPEKRIDVNLNAKQAKKIGLIDKVIRLEPNQIAAMSEKFVAFADFDDMEVIEKPKEKVEAKKTEEIIKNEIKKTMTREELKVQFPEVYKAIIQEERERVQAIMEFSDIDLEACKTQIDGGQNPSQKFFAEMARKGMAANTLQSAKDEKIKDIVTKEEPVKKEDAEKAQAEKEAFEAAGLKIEEVK
jgi:ATP-dependent protease ClpP protease subunit